jgi:hypothetical protein
MRGLFLVAIWIGWSLPSAGFAQVPSGEIPPVQASPSADAPRPAPPELVAKPSTGGSDLTLGEGQKGPTIVPPNVDPEIGKLPPSTASQMPIVKPPTMTEGGNKLQSR